MNLVVAYVELQDATAAAAGPRARYVDTSADDHAYWRLLDSLWAAGRTFILLEQDIVPPPGALAALDACPAEWCGVPYPVGNIWGVFHGAVKYDASLIARYPEAVRSMRVRDWITLDSQLIAYINRRQKEGPHWHWPAAQHLNVRSVPSDHVFANCGDCGSPLRFTDLRGGPDASRCPGCGRTPAYHPLGHPVIVLRRRTDLSTELTYVGRGKYLNGVPAADLETDDEELIGLALDSGLYVRANTRKAAEVAAIEAEVVAEEQAAAPPKKAETPRAEAKSNQP